MNNPYEAPVASLPPYAYPSQPAGSGLGVTETCVTVLRQTKPWVTLMSVLAFLGSLFMVGAGLVMVVAGMATGVGSGKGFETRVMAILGIVYLPIGALYFYPALKLWMYGGAIGRLVATGSVAELESALVQQKHFWKFTGIAALALVVLYAIAMLAMMIFGFSKALGR